MVVPPLSHQTETRLVLTLAIDQLEFLMFVVRGSACVVSPWALVWGHAFDGLKYVVVTIRL